MHLLRKFFDRGEVLWKRNVHSVDSPFAVDRKIEGLRHILDALTVLRRATGRVIPEHHTIPISQLFFSSTSEKIRAVGIVL